MKRTTVLLAATATTLGLAACGTSTGDAVEGSSAPPSSVGASGAVSSTATSSAATGVREASCTDAAGDGGSADIVSVELADDGGDLRATFNLATPPNTATGTLLLSLIAWSEDGGAGRQLGIHWIDGELSVFTFDLVESQNEYLRAEPTIQGGAVSITFPESAVEGLGGTWRWSAGTSVDGTDVDDCPDPGDDYLNPARQTFPG